MINEYLEPEKVQRPVSLSMGSNEQGGSLYIIVSGKLRVYRTGKNMAEVELATLNDE